MHKTGAFYPLLLLALWSALLAGADYTVADTSIRQALARHFASTRGKMLQSKVGRGYITHRGVDFDYAYSVNGIDYTGHRYRYDDHNTAFEYGAVTNAYPLGSRQTVYYNPSHPADSLLQPGLAGRDLLLLLFALPFNVATFGLWSAVARARREDRRLRKAGGIRILSGEGETRARLAAISPAFAGLIGLAATAFILVFPVISFVGLMPAMSLMWTIWGLVLAAGAACSLWAALRNHSGRHDLRINDLSQTVTLPRAAGRGEPLTLPAAGNPCRLLATPCYQRSQRQLLHLRPRHPARRHRLRPAGPQTGLLGLDARQGTSLRPMAGGPIEGRVQRDRRRNARGIGASPPAGGNAS